jgi:hypothetical protein
MAVLDEHTVNTDSSNNREQNTDAEARRDPAQSHNYKGEADNVNDDKGRPLDEKELDHARNKANEGLQQERDRS